MKTVWEFCPVCGAFIPSYQVICGLCYLVLNYDGQLQVMKIAYDKGKRYSERRKRVRKLLVGY